MNMQMLLTKIKETGMTDKEIGDEIDAASSIVTRLRNGKHKTTSYERGEAIIKLARKRLPDLFADKDEAA